MKLQIDPEDVSDMEIDSDDIPIPVYEDESSDSSSLGLGDDPLNLDVEPDYMEVESSVEDDESNPGGIDHENRSISEASVITGSSESDAESNNEENEEVSAEIPETSSSLPANVCSVESTAEVNVDTAGDQNNEPSEISASLNILFAEMTKFFESRPQDSGFDFMMEPDAALPECFALEWPKIENQVVDGNPGTSGLSQQTLTPEHGTTSCNANMQTSGGIKRKLAFDEMGVVSAPKRLAINTADRNQSIQFQPASLACITLKAIQSLLAKGCVEENILPPKKKDEHQDEI